MGADGVISSRCRGAVRRLAALTALLWGAFACGVPASDAGEAPAPETNGVPAPGAGGVPAAGAGGTPAPGAAAAPGDWPVYGGDWASRHYAPLSQINAGNVAQLAVAWTWESPDNAKAREDPALTPWLFKSSPLAIDGTLYINTSLGFVVALDGATGEERWRFDTGTWLAGRPTNLGFNHRGVAYWTDGEAARVLVTTNDAKLWSLDAGTGKPDPAFGEAGRVDLTQGLGREIDAKHYSVIGPPAIVRNVAVVGSSIFDGPTTRQMPPGHVRGYDVRNGRQRWRFHTIPQAGEVGVETWEGDAWRVSGNTNVWTTMSVDTAAGYVYLPVGTPTNDWYGGHRLGDNLFAESLVCVDGATGERVWHFQMVHHGLWDYDLPAAPNLVDIVVDGEAIKAVAQVSKQGFVYVFNRLTGVPVWPIVERPVLPSTVPGERASPTQPFPTKPAPFDEQGFSDATLIDFTPELKAEAKRIAAQYDQGPLYTPPSLKGTIQLPGWGGGANWSGAGFDPDTNILYVPSMTSPMVVRLQATEPGAEFRYRRSYGVNRIAGPDRLPLTKPPYARITAINLNTGEHVWMTPHGEGIRQTLIERGIPDPGPVGAWGGTGPLVTKTLLFLGHASDEPPLLRAFDKATGAVTHALALPAAPTGTPITYLSGGKQFIAVAAGGGDDAKLMALALP